MRTEEKFEDTLKEIETAIIRIYKASPEMTDHFVNRALDSAILQYRALERGHVVKPTTLTGKELALFEAITAVCSAWEKDKRGPLSATDILTCLRRLQKSVEVWIKMGGRRGYFDHVSQFLD